MTSFDLVAGTNRLEVVVSAENGINATTYVIVVVRAGVSIDLSAISLAATTVAPAFDVLTLAYTATQANTEVRRGLICVFGLFALQTLTSLSFVSCFF